MPSKWFQCLHTCDKYPNPASRLQNGTKSYTYQGEVVHVSALHIYRGESSQWKKHAAAALQHKHCGPDCPGYPYVVEELAEVLAQDGSRRKGKGKEPGKAAPKKANATAGELRRELTRKDWSRWGLALALSAQKKTDGIPERYVARAKEYLRATEKDQSGWAESTDEESTDDEEGAGVQEKNEGEPGRDEDDERGDEDDEGRGEERNEERGDEEEVHDRVPPRLTRLRRLAKRFRVTSPESQTTGSPRHTPNLPSGSTSPSSSTRPQRLTDLFPPLLSMPPDHPPFKVVWVENIMRTQDVEDALENLSWIYDVLPQDIALVIKKVWPRLIYIPEDQTSLDMKKRPAPCRRYNEPTIVVIEEQAFLAGHMILLHNEFDVKLMAWSEFRDRILKGKLGKAILEADAILGAFDVALDFLAPDCGYGFTPQTFNRYYEKMVELSYAKVVSPNPVENIISGDKLSYLQEAAAVSSKHGFPIPLIATFNPNLDRIRRPAVYKRNYSDCSIKVLFPATEGDQEVMETIRKDVRESAQWYSGVQISGVRIQPQWFAMSFMPGLKMKGELRVFLLAGKPAYIMSTKSLGEEMVFHTVEHVTPLDAVAEDDLGQGNIDIFQLQEGTKAYLHYADVMLRGVIESREKKGLHCSDLRTFCRLDIAYFCDSNGRPHYYLSEIESGHITTLIFRDKSESERLGLTTTMLGIWRTKFLYREQGRIV
ncbi:hypothetical protein DXG01_011321 [Tephrocybe rancida]|nr:hypothetical protein DXG01_011321 [Tephrocybe rancida]